MARQNFNVITNNTPAIDGVFGVNLMLGSNPDPTKDGPHEYFIAGSSLPTTDPSWDGRVVTWTVDIKGITYQFTGDFSSRGRPFKGSVAWKDPAAGQDSWSAGSGQEEDEDENEELSASA